MRRNRHNRVPNAIEASDATSEDIVRLEGAAKGVWRLVRNGIMQPERGLQVYMSRDTARICQYKSRAVWSALDITFDITRDSWVLTEEEVRPTLEDEGFGHVRRDCRTFPVTDLYPVIATTDICRVRDNGDLEIVQTTGEQTKGLLTNRQCHNLQAMLEAMLDSPFAA